MPVSAEQKGLGALIGYLHTNALRSLKRVSSSDWRRRLISSRESISLFDLSRSEDRAAENEVIGIISESKKCSQFYVITPEARAHDSGFVGLVRIVVRTNKDDDKSINLELVLLKPRASDELGIGYRFECPEGGQTNHNFYHAQPIRILKGTVATDEIEIPGLPAWYPDNFPSFPIQASDYLDLMLYGVHVVCGLSCIENLARKNSGTGIIGERAVKMLKNFNSAS